MGTLALMFGVSSCGECSPALFTPVDVLCTSCCSRLAIVFVPCLVSSLRLSMDVPIVRAMSSLVAVVWLFTDVTIYSEAALSPALSRSVTVRVCRETCSAVSLWERWIPIEVSVWALWTASMSAACLASSSFLLFSLSSLSLAIAVFTPSISLSMVCEMLVTASAPGRDGHACPL